VSTRFRRTAVVAPVLMWLLAVALRGSHRESTADTPQAPLRLSDTGLYARGRVGQIDGSNRPFSPQYPLWSDGLTKRRWIYLPGGTRIDGGDEHAWRFPVGTKIWKEFARGNGPVETRMLWKAAADSWVFASYVWETDGSDAVLAPDEGIAGVVEVAPGRRHSIPSRTDCIACHGAPAQVRPLGFTALQLSTDRDPQAIHAEPLTAGMLTNQLLVDEGWLAGARHDLLTRPPRIRTSSPATRSVLGYLHANCGICHNGKGEIAAVGPVIRTADLVADGDAVARSLIGQRTRWQVPGAGQEESMLVHAGAPERSALYMRMRSRAPSSQMPPLGTTLRDQVAVDAVARWISTELGGRRE
jgi:mono/diheme cytochrome c family protein